MTARLVGRALRGLSLAQLRHVTPVRARAAPPGVRRVYRAVEREFGVLAPPLAAHAAAPATLAACWALLRETLLVPGAASREAKEAVAAAVSVGNVCPYCVTMHAGALRGLAAGPVARAVERGAFEAIPEGGTRAVAGWAAAGARRDSAGPPPFPAAAPELMGVALLLHYLNRVVNVFLGELPLPPWAPARTMGAVSPVLAWVIRSAGRRVGPPGRAPAAGAAPPPDLRWAAGNGSVARAVAEAALAAEAAGARAAPLAVRELLAGQLADWDGRPRGPSRAWVDDAVAPLTPGERPAGRVALLVALASYQVTDDDLAALPEPARDERALVELVSWAAMAAARTVVAWSAPEAA
ncbi:carboxymuconolactone decarboxylase family protein [Streptomyces sedi]|uniref:Carboxymuconolactone decarboxylase family protein n=1 Tax=Streptomyces sedi TaxID=555059 RepID=A0A5C4VH09_9ACTN|nr:carboxymuconolactone decarboxylase family protein [Streptomyces sedi]TNM34329.1 carboxymuconolactone decarboxylase family protein [Streptomyces sedi]